MHLDEFGLPMQADRDRNDQLNRVGLILLAKTFTKPEVTFAINALHYTCWKAVVSWLQPKPGVYTRYKGSDPNNVSADQLIPVLCYWVAVGFEKQQIKDMYLAMLSRFGFAQNIYDGLDGKQNKWKVPDLMVFRAMPLFSRGLSNAFGVSRYLWDLYLVAMLIWDLLYMKFGKDPCDVNCTLTTFLTCIKVKPTFISVSVWNLWLLYGNPYERLKRYHRADALGNPEIAEMYKEFLFI